MNEIIQNQFGFIITIFLLVMTITNFLIIIYKLIGNFKKSILDFLFSLIGSTPSQLKGPLMSNQKLLILQQLKIMKKFIGIGVLIIILAVTSIGSIIVLDSREYFEEYFEVQRTKLNLRNEASVDSLITVIKIKEKTTDSLMVVNEAITRELKSVKSQIWQTNKSVNALKGVIEHQDKMIKSQALELIDNNK